MANRIVALLQKSITRRWIPNRILSIYCYQVTCNWISHRTPWKRQFQRSPQPQVSVTFLKAPRESYGSADGARWLSPYPWRSLYKFLLRFCLNFCRGGENLQGGTTVHVPAHLGLRWFGTADANLWEIFNASWLAAFTLSWFPSQATQIWICVSNGWMERRHTAWRDIFAILRYDSDLQVHRVTLGFRCFSVEMHVAADCSGAEPIVLSCRTHRLELAMAQSEVRSTLAFRKAKTFLPSAAQQDK